MKGYWEFEGVVETFSDANPGRVVRCSNGAIYRRAGSKTLILVPPSDWDFSEIASREGFRVDRCKTVPLPSIPDWLPSRSGGECFYIDGDWSPSKRGAKATRAGNRAGIEFCVPTEEELRTLVGEWKEWAASRHHMVVVGHYLAMARSKRFEFFGYRLDGKLVGALGFTGEGRDAAVGFTKHHGIWWLAAYIWTDALVRLQSRYDYVNIGDTASTLKREIGAKSFPTRELYHAIDPRRYSRTRKTYSMGVAIALRARRSGEEERAETKSFGKAILSLRPLLGKRWVWWYYDPKTAPMLPRRSEKYDAEGATNLLDSVLVLGHPSQTLVELARDVEWYAANDSFRPSAIIYNDAASVRFDPVYYSEALGVELKTLRCYLDHAAEVLKPLGNYRVHDFFMAIDPNGKTTPTKIVFVREDVKGFK